MKKIVFGFIFGTLFCSCFSIIATNVIPSGSVSYSNNKTSETTVNGALNELFNAVDINEKIVAMEQRIIELETNSLTVNETYPVGSIYISTSGTNPETIFTGTTWERYGVGKTLLSTDGTSGQTGGSNTVTLSTSNLPSHAHSIPALSGTAASAGAHTHFTATSTGQATDSTTSNMQTGAIAHQNNGGSTIQYYSLQYSLAFGGTANSGLTSSNGAHTHSVSTNASTTGASGSGKEFSVQNPYITVYMWKRTK